MTTIFNKPARSVWLIGAMTFAITGLAAGQATNPPGGTDAQPRREPPPQAYQDCIGKKAGDLVQITTPREGNISATCTTSPKGLFARPEHPPCERDGSGKNQNNQNK